MKIYERIAYVLEHNFHIKEFVIFENLSEQKRRKIVYKTQATTYVTNENFERSPHSCRVFRTNLVTISEDISLSLLIYTNTKEELSKVKELAPIISNYFEIAEPVLQTKSLMERLNERSLKDPMTKLYNRRFFHEYMDKNINDKSHFSLMMLDIDFFKAVNDTYGHDIGDKVIIEVAQVFKKVLKGSDLAIRFGGEEFVIITFNTTQKDAQKIANTIKEEFAKIIFNSDTEKFSKTLSIGIANFPEDSSLVSDIVKFADIALYYAKEHGRNQVIIYEKKMKVQE